jgi:hypothetical protein
MRERDIERYGEGERGDKERGGGLRVGEGVGERGGVVEREGGGEGEWVWGGGREREGGKEGEGEWERKGEQEKGKGREKERGGGQRERYG